MRVLWVLVLAVVLGAAQARAGGLHEAPDGVGNPSGRDYGGYRVLYFVPGLVDTTAQASDVKCVNLGANATSITLQVWDAAASAAAAPSFDSHFTLDVADVDSLTIGVGAIPEAAIGRIAVQDPRAVVLCHGRLFELGAVSVTTELELTRVGKPPKLAIH